jgi:hypothetical protein
MTWQCLHHVHSKSTHTLLHSASFALLLPLRLSCNSHTLRSGLTKCGHACDVQIQHVDLVSEVHEIALEPLMHAATDIADVLSREAHGTAHHSTPPTVSLNVSPSHPVLDSLANSLSQYPAVNDGTSLFMLTMDALVVPHTSGSHFSESSKSATATSSCMEGDLASPFEAPFNAPFEAPFQAPFNAPVTSAEGQGSQTVMFALPAILEENGGAGLLSMPVRCHHYSQNG